MSYHSQYHFYSRIIISLLFFTLGVFVLQQSVSTTAQVAPADNIELSGWAWNDQVGWISLNCKNDFDGDGDIDNACWNTNYKVYIENINQSGIDVPHVKGCAWAGTGSYSTGTTAGWLCFSDPGGTNAPLNGIPIPQTSYNIQTWSCQMDLGQCNNDPTENCNNFAQCGAGNWCVQPLLKGVCYDYAEPGDYPGHPRDIVDYNPWDPEPRADNWSYCYVDSACPQLGVLNSDECVYPQVNDRGACAVDISGTISYSGQVCTFDDDCTDFSPGIEYCEIAMPNDFVFTPSIDCTAFASNPTDPNACAMGYSCQQAAIDNYEAYPNALSHASEDPKASWLKIANTSGIAGEDLLSFYIANEATSSAPLTMTYDPDHPDLENGQSQLNPINGCFNCYTEEIKRCTVGNAICSSDTNCNTCNQITHKCSSDSSRACLVDADCLNTCEAGFCKHDATQACTSDTDCTLASQCTVRQVNKKCDNCLEYFYYKDETIKRCDNDNQVTSCNSDSDCFGGNCISYPANKRCEGYNYFYCNNDDDCIEPDACGAQDCTSDASNICSSNADCPLSYYCSVTRYCGGDNSKDICSQDSDCLNTCEAGFCRNDSDLACNSDADCGSSLICPGQPGYCAGGSCNSDADCAADYYCPTRNCVMNPTQSCTSDADCSAPAKDFRPCTSIDRDAGTLEKVLGGFNCSDCTIENIENSCTLNAYNQNINRCGTCQYIFKTPGVILDNHHNRLDGLSQTANLCGWAWNGAVGSSYHEQGGIGWVNFSPAITTSTNPYFAVEQGDIYSQKNILNRYRPPFRKYNASYLIESGGSILNLVSSSTISEVFQGELSYRPVIDFLQENTGKYKNTLGTLDYRGLITPASKNLSNQELNKYGSVIRELSSSDLGNLVDDLSNQPLNNQVFYISAAALAPGGGNLVIDHDLEFKIGGNNPVIQSGAGVVIVEGNVKIEADISYETSATIRYLKNIPSVVWIIKGDVIIDPSVTRVVGTFAVLGDGLNNCATDPVIDGCGQFITGSSGGPGSQLQVTGSVLARRFSLDRRYVDQINKEPAEKFISDGRLQANPPLGLVDFSKAIPRFSD